ncbi:MAG: putative Zn-dependent protease with MMP-like domain, partial [Kiritimatiellia bacterium]
AEAHHELGDYTQAEGLYRRCTQLVPDHALSWSGLALVLFDQLQMEPAQTMVLRALRQDDANAEAYYTRAILRERRGDNTGADRDYRRAWRLEPERYPAPIRMDDDAIRAIITQALAESPAELRDALKRIDVVVADLPTDEVCRNTEPPTPPTDILGVISGPIAFADEAQAATSITVYRKNLERVAWDREALLLELRMTLLAELEHHLGLNTLDVR